MAKKKFAGGGNIMGARAPLPTPVGPNGVRGGSPVPAPAPAASGLTSLTPPAGALAAAASVGAGAPGNAPQANPGWRGGMTATPAQSAADNAQFAQLFANSGAGYKKGGSVKKSSARRGDGIAQRGRTRA